MLKYKLAAGFLASTLLLGITANANAEIKETPFTDIAGSFAEEAVIQLADQSIISGITPENFAPGEKTSRKHFLVLMAKVVGIQPLFPNWPTFTDLPPGTPEFGHIEALVKLGIVQGTGAGLLGADTSISRQDTAVLLHRILSHKTKDIPALEENYLDQAQVSPYAADSISYVTQEGLMQGSNNYFHPLRKLTRAEAAVLANRIYNMRKELAISASDNSMDRQLEVKVGEPIKLELPTSQEPLSFTPVYGLDNTEIGTIYPNGTFMGQQPGTGTITINVGYNTYLVKITVTSKDQP